jgi:hypothetical protein
MYIVVFWFRRRWLTHHWSSRSFWMTVLTSTVSRSPGAMRYSRSVAPEPTVMPFIRVS